MGEDQYTSSEWPLGKTLAIFGFSLFSRKKVRSTRRRSGKKCDFFVQKTAVRVNFLLKNIRCTMYNFYDSTDTLKFWTEKRTINKTFLFFHPILMKLGEVVVIHVYYNFTKFHQNQMKNKKVLLIAHFSVQNFKVSVELWKSYIVK